MLAGVCQQKGESRLSAVTSKLYRNVCCQSPCQQTCIFVVRPDAVKVGFLETETWKVFPHLVDRTQLAVWCRVNPSASLSLHFLSCTKGNGENISLWGSNVRTSDSDRAIAANAWAGKKHQYLWLLVANIQPVLTGGLTLCHCKGRVLCMGLGSCWPSLG